MVELIITVTTPFLPFFYNRRNMPTFSLFFSLRIKKRENKDHFLLKILSLKK